MKDNENSDIGIWITFAKEKGSWSETIDKSKGPHISFSLNSLDIEL